MNDQYDCLNKAQLSFEYLHSNSTTHTFLFGALAELVDNARDANARNLQIFTCKDSTLRGGVYLTFLDDGCGMNYDDVFNVIVFGKSTKRQCLDSKQIGQYGNGLKSGAMRAANDLILFTKKDNLGTCLLLSRTFHQEEHLAQILCPMPCWDLSTEQPLTTTMNDDVNGTRSYIYDSSKYELEMQIIFKYSPFKTMEDLLKQFRLITSTSGTLIVLYNLKLSECGETELDVKSDPLDILIDSKNRQNLFDDHDESTPPEYRSLRAYLSILYYEPRMRISIQGQRVLTKKLPYTLYKPRQYQFKSTRFKSRSEEELKKREKDLDTLQERIREVDSQVHHVQQSMSVPATMEERTKLRKIQINAMNLKDMFKRLQNELTSKKNDMHRTRTLNFIFGLNINNRLADGVFVYNAGRLIKMYEKLGQSNKKTLYCRGIVGVVDVPSLVLEPTHNKQAFADEKEYHFLLKHMAEYMRQYWTDAGIEDHVKEFWLNYGYRDEQFDRLPSNESDAMKRRQLAVPMVIQCEKCLKWRRIPHASNGTTLTQSQLESWECAHNIDPLNNSCSANEKLESIPEGELSSRVSLRSSVQLTPPAIRSFGKNKRSLSTALNHTFQVTTQPKTGARSSTDLKVKRRQKRLKPSADNGEESSFDDSTNSTNSIDPINDDNTENIDHTSIPPPLPTIGARVWAMYQGARRPGKILTVNDKRGMFRIRFDEFPTAEFDYSFSYKSPAWSYIDTPPSPTDQQVSTVDADENELLSSIAKKFKALIKFMLPPDWKLTREDISSMNYEDLRQFDVSVFLQSYREKMTKIVEQRKTDEAHWRTSVQRLQGEITDLLNLSGMPIANDCSVEDFEKQVQNYTTQMNKSDRS